MIALMPLLAQQFPELMQLDRVVGDIGAPTSEFSLVELLQNLMLIFLCRRFCLDSFKRSFASAYDYWVCRHVCCLSDPRARLLP